MDILKKMLDQNHGASFCELPAERQAEYLCVVAQRGAAEALRAIGLDDENAAADLKDIRDLLRAMRVLKKAAWTTTINAIGRIIGWGALLLLAALFMNGKQVRDLFSLIAS